MTETDDKQEFRTAREYVRAHESQAPDPEAVACVMCVAALNPLTESARERVLKYLNGPQPEPEKEYRTP